jgi:glyoxylase-like metal-dependent hydrolase (beta-lactamase superfamily II)
MTIQDFFHRASGTVTYVVYDESSKDAVIIDPCLDFDPVTFAITTEFLDPIVQFVETKTLNLRWVLETHIHADHLTGAAYLREKFPTARYGIGEGVRDVQISGKEMYGLARDAFPVGWPFDGLFRNGETIEAGSLAFKVLASPGHTPSCVAYLVNDCLFTGDVMFMPERGTGRCDFPGGDAKQLFQAIQRIYELPEKTSVYIGHDYPDAKDAHSHRTTIGEQKSKNIHVKASTKLEEFVKFRTERDLTLALPKLFYASLFTNIRGGVLPEKDAAGRRFFPIPVTASF